MELLFWKIQPCCVDTALRGFYVFKYIEHWKGGSPPPSLYLCMYMYVCKFCKCLNLWLPLQAGTAAGLTLSCPHYKEICVQLLSVVFGLLFLSWLLFSNLLNCSVCLGCFCGLGLVYSNKSCTMPPITFQDLPLNIYMVIFGTGIFVFILSLIFCCYFIRSGQQKLKRDWKQEMCKNKQTQDWFKSVGELVNLMLFCLGLVSFQRKILMNQNVSLKTI